MSKPRSEATAPMSRSGLESIRSTRKAGRSRKYASLVVYHRDGAEVVRLEPGSPIILGRDPEADLFVADRNLSRRHARFEVRGDGVVVEDLDSTNGTWCNGERVRRARLREGDEVAVGSVVVTLLSIDPMESRLYGLESHDRFLAGVEEELARAKTFGRQVGLVVVRSVGPRLRPSRWCPRLRERLRPFDRLALYSTEMVEFLLPEVTVEQTTELATTIAEDCREGEPPRVCGVALYPESASSAAEMIQVACDAARRAGSESPVVWAPSIASQVSPPAPAGDPSLAPIVISDAMKAVYETVDRVAGSAIPVLIHGETGTGKELVARAIHQRGDRRDAPLCSVNCAAIPEQLVESTLFGHERGAFTGAGKRAAGIFETADGGTVFLDEVGELPARAQAALLRVLDTGRFTRVGSTREIAVRVRVLAATHRDLERMCGQGAFREDLLYRLSALVVSLPPLRERPDEIEPLALHLLAQANRANGSALRGIDPEALTLLRAHPWPGNVRELRNAIERAVVISQGEWITADDLPERVRKCQTGVKAAERAPGAGTHLERTSDLRASVERYEAELILDALHRTHGDRREAAQQLSLPLRTLARKIQVLGIKKVGPAYEWKPGDDAATGDYQAPGEEKN